MTARYAPPRAPPSATLRRAAAACDTTRAMAKIGRNEPCPCGSGRKHKKCCADAQAAQAYTAEDRARAFLRLDDWIDAVAGDEADEAHAELWGRFVGHEDALAEGFAEQSEGVEDLWFAFDRDGVNGVPIADELVAEEDRDLGPGERAFLAALRQSTMRLYEVIDVVPGASLTLRDVVEGGDVTVRERQGSRSIGRHTYLAARVVPRGPSGGAELERGVLHIPSLVKDSVLAQLRAARARFLDERRGAPIDEFYKQTAPFFHDAWVSALLDPVVPTVKFDGEDVVPTTVEFDVVAGATDEALARALDGHAELAREGDAWRWTGTTRDGRPTLLGTIERRGERLVLEAMTVERAARGRALLEAAVGPDLRHRATVHDSLQRAVKDQLRAGAGAGADEAEADGPDAIPREIAEALVLGHYATYYRKWIDEPVPALDGATPREAAQQPARRERARGLVNELVAMYQRALRDDAPAYDPSWMYAELGLVDEDAARHPPPLAYERVADAVAGSAERARALAERARAAPGFDEAVTVVADDAVAADLAAQRFVRGDGAAAAPYLRLMADHELHRRKVFWVDEALAYLLDQTELDVVGRELRAPFPAFALVFTDRQVLSYGERLLAGERTSPLAGHLLRVLTVHVAERRQGGGRGRDGDDDTDGRTLELTFLLDALGADLPALVRHELPLDDDAPVRAYLDRVAPLPDVDPPPPDTSPTRGLLRAVINTILYATSASVAPERRAPPAPRPRASPSPARAFSSDAVYYLPGTIDIGRVRKLQELERAPDGRALLRRHMVRGHWRRAAKGWADQRLRWIEPYWKGPDLAAIIERAYRLEP